MTIHATTTLIPVDLDGVAAALKRRASQQDLDIVARIELVRQRRT
jgi:hypothetical protein